MVSSTLATTVLFALPAAFGITPVSMTLLSTILAVSAAFGATTVPLSVTVSCPFLASLLVSWVGLQGEVADGVILPLAETAEGVAAFDAAVEGVVGVTGGVTEGVGLGCEVADRVVGVGDLTGAGRVSGQQQQRQQEVKTEGGQFMKIGRRFREICY